MATGVEMRTVKSVFGVISALGPVLYCGGLAYHFLDLSGSMQEAQEIGLGPTVIGLAVVGLLFCIPLILKLVRIFRGPRLPGPEGRGGADAPERDDEDGFDPDAAIARYMAQRSAEAVVNTPAGLSAHGRGPAKRPGFGRRTR